MLGKKDLTIILILLIVIFGALVAESIVSSGAKNVKLTAAPALAGAVAQGLYAGNSSTTPTYGKDFILKDTRYFDNNSWAVTTVSPIKNEFDPGLVILQKQQGAYQIVAGPGSSFPKDYLVSLPQDVAAYLGGQGAVYESLGD